MVKIRKPSSVAQKVLTISALLLLLPGMATAISIDGSISDTRTRIESVKSDLETKRDTLLNSHESILQLEQQLAPLREDIATLKGQLGNIDDMTVLSERKIANIAMQIDKKEIDLGAAMEHNEMVMLELKEERENLSKYANSLYNIESQLIDFDTKEVSAVKLLLADGAVSDVSRSLNYISSTQQAHNAVLAYLDEKYDMAQVERQEINQIREQLEELRQESEKERNELALQKEAKEKLLEMTQGKESEYQTMLEDAIAQQKATLSDIAGLESDSEYLEERLAALQDRRAKVGSNAVNVYGNDVSYSDLDAINRLLGAEHQSLMWPVDPSRGITAYFHDSSYKSYFGVTHEAIDLRAYQSSNIYAPADAVVYKIRDNGYGYSYLILAHADNTLTVYGHISEFDVEEGDLVLQGDVIAKSGGMPGTKGAGTMTTGPHLHFEVYKDGVHVDPLDYLPVFDLPAEYIPARYFDQLQNADLDQSASEMVNGQ